MKWTRREFVRTSATGLLVLGAGCLPVRDDEPPKKLDILVLGGTGFLGPAFVQAAIDRGHRVTLFNRGKTNPHLFPDLEKLKGDRRASDLEAIKGRRWDVVVDTSGYVPRIVDESASILAEAGCGQYVFISSISVYKDFPAKDTDESSPVGRLDDPTVEEITNQSYGPLKALCEEAAEKHFPGRTTNIRPGYIVGERDRSDRFTYWPVRVSEGGEVLAPGKPDHVIQFVDVHDLGEWMLHTAEREIIGVFNAHGPDKPMPMGTFLEACKSVTESDASFTWVDPTFMRAQGVFLPIYTPPPEGGEFPCTCSAEKAMKQGLKFRPVEETLRSTLAWHRSRGAEYQLRGRGERWNPEREKEVLAAWKAGPGKA